MLNPDFIEKMRAKLASIVQGGDGPDRERALDLLTQRHAKEISSPVPYTTEYGRLLAECYADRVTSSDLRETEKWILWENWFLAGEGLPSFEIHAEIQRDYLVALDPSAAPEIDAMESLLSTDLWVDVAAHGLAPDAAKRIAEEIEAHYADALEEELATGKDHVRAHLESLKRLGDPLAARRIFKKTYLTAQEDYRLSHMPTWSRWPMGIETKPYKRVCIFVFLVYFFGVGGSFVWILFVASMVACFFVSSRIVAPLIQRGEGQRAYLWSMLYNAFFVALICRYWFMADFTFIPGAPVILSVILLLPGGVLGLGYIIWCAYSYAFLVRKQIPSPENDS